MAFIVKFLMCLMVQIALAEQMEPGTRKYFLSAMVMERNQTTLLLEFVRHYLEEGVEHFFIYNSQNVPHIHHELDCLDQKYYTIIPHLGEDAKKETVRQDVYQIVRNQTQWLAVVDSDDFISSRAYPTKTIREILEGGNHAVCKVISVPTLNYAWGDTQETPLGDIRSTLTHRWGYEPRFNHSDARKAARSNKFTDSFEKVKNRMIVSTQHVANVRTNTATLYSKGNICVSSTQQYQSCAHFVQDVPAAEPLPAMAANPTLTTASTTSTTATKSNLPVDTLTGKGSAHPIHLLPRYCPERNVFRSKRSMSSLYLLEQDIPGLSLAVHHYRVPSQREWDRLSTLYPGTYPPVEQPLANRMDVVDRHMLEREQHRKYHSLQKEAEKALQKCDQQADQRLNTAQTTTGLSSNVASSVSNSAPISNLRVSSTGTSNSGSSDTTRPGDVQSGFTFSTTMKSATGSDTNTADSGAVAKSAVNNGKSTSSVLGLVKSYFKKYVER